MDWGEITNHWHGLVGSMRRRWDKLSDQELHAIAGEKDTLIQKLKEKYGMSHEQAEKEVQDWHQSQTAGQTRSSGGSH